MATVNASEGKSTHPGWIEDVNRFSLEKPPDWFLSGLTNYDSQLVIIPSRKNRAYLLCRRRQFTRGLGDVAMMDNKHPDTNMCFAYGVLPIAPIVSRSKKNIEWTQENMLGLIEELKAKDTWAASEKLGGRDGRIVKDPYAVADMVDRLEAEAAARQDANMVEDFRHRARDGWRSLQARMGWRNKRASDHHGVARPHKGQRVILTDAQ